jgi:hypothetical protein
MRKDFSTNAIFPYAGNIHDGYARIAPALRRRHRRAVSGFVMREQKQDVANEIAVVSELYFNTTAASSARTRYLELNTIAPPL